jgi:hypothetical protein
MDSFGDMEVKMSERLYVGRVNGCNLFLFPKKGPEQVPNNTTATDVATLKDSIDSSEYTDWNVPDPPGWTLFKWFMQRVKFTSK